MIINLLLNLVYTDNLLCFYSIYNIKMIFKANLLEI